MRLTAAFAAIGITLIGFAAFSLYPEHAAADTTVEVGNTYFCAPSFHGGTCTTNITAGETVTWHIADGTHTVTECAPDAVQCPQPGGFDSGALSTGQTFSQTFTAAGSYEYRCQVHSTEMYGVIVVSAPTPTPATAASSPTAVPSAQAPVHAGGPPQAGASSVWPLLLGALGVAMLLGSAVLGYAAVRRR